MGQEESSAFTYLEVYGEDGADVPPEIIVAPKDTQIVKGTQVTELQVNSKQIEKDYEYTVAIYIHTVYIQQFTFNDLSNQSLTSMKFDL